MWNKIKKLLWFKTAEEIETDYVASAEKRINFHYVKSAELFDKYKLELDESLYEYQVQIDRTKETYDRQIRNLEIARDERVLECVKAMDVLKERKEAISHIKYETTEEIKNG